MTARERLVSLQRLVLTAVVLRAACIGGSVTLVSLAVARLIALPPAGALLVASIGIFVAVLLGARGWNARSLARVALWVEERHPALRYALVTAAEAPSTAEVEAQALAVPWWSTERRTLARALAGPAASVLVAVVLLALSQRIEQVRALVPDVATAPGAARPVRVADPPTPGAAR